MPVFMLLTMPHPILKKLCLHATLLASVCLMQPAWAQSTPDPVPLLRFSEFFKRPMGSKGAEMDAALLQRDGQTVRLQGYMVQQEQPAPGRFMLTPRPVRMSEHADGEADDLPVAWTMVYLDASQQDFAVPYTSGRIEVRGVLSVGRLEEQDGRVSWVRLRLGTESTRAMSAAELADLQHTAEHAH